MSFAQGFQAGLSAVRQFQDMRDERQKREDLTELQKQRDAMLEAQKAQGAQEQQLIQQGVPLSSPVANPDGLPTMLGATPVAAGNMSPVAPQGGVPLGQPQAVQFAQAAENLPTMSQAEYLRKQADVYTRLGDTDAAMGLMNQATALDRQAIQDERYQTDLDFRRQAQEITNQQEARRQAEYVSGRQEEGRKVLRAQATNTFLDGLATGQYTTTDAAKYAAENNLDIAELGSKALNFYNLTEAEAKKKQVELTRQVAGLSFGQLLELHKSDDTITPGRHFEVEENDDGVMLVEMNTETGEKIRDLQQFPSTMAAESAMRSLASDYGTAVDSLVNTEAKRRVTAAENAIERAKIAVDVSKIDAGLREEAVKEIGKLKSDPAFMSMTPGQQDAYIAKNIYDVLGIAANGGQPDRDKGPEGTYLQRTAGLRSRTEAQERAAKIKDFADIQVSDLDKFTPPEIRELEANIDFLPADVAEQLAERLENIDKAQNLMRSGLISRSIATAL